MSACSHARTPTQVRLCQCCELPVDIVDLKKGYSADCPRCGTQLYRSESYSIGGNLALAITCLLLFVPSHYFDFITIRLVGMMIEGTLMEGVFALIKEGYPGLALLTLFCHTIAPLAMCATVLTAHVALKYRWFNMLKISLNILSHSKHWVMLDVFLISVAISCFKLQDYSDIYVGNALYSLVILQVLTIVLVNRVSTRRYWESWQAESSLPVEAKEIHCHTCHLSQPDAEFCVRCHNPLHHRKPNSMQKTWALLIAATVAIFPANLVPISILITNGQRLEDTIFSGVASLINNDMLGIAIIIFVASIVVPVAKIIGLSYLMFCIQFDKVKNHKVEMSIYRAIKWIGKWSMTDLFVISIMLTLVDRGQILNFTPGFGAVAFGIVVVLTMFAAETLDPRLLWDRHNSKPSLQPETKVE
ncbi:Inner membrane protein YebS [Vibrio mediterranei]|uniref:Paraquat-inducible protein A n=2 Tax=Vibrio TaxID=662 RepID=A0ABX5D975_9VIBR|nr:paraquat-inducible protein A [Vibrio mediterranei]MCG9661613.1 paraquat-inducible protein A [Vibrio mediterranei]PCD87009.1 paraquat-inducible protein A [Vibrio mediterranei]PRQ66219.1 paraquat-inducible protein A [Vibrio mediterranei]PTC04150.1 paraquat-inducible protein A [Vibrio mediterranei]SBO11690.1 Inner membrane protein YebS [Vibrio mediterranei]